MNGYLEDKIILYITSGPLRNQRGAYLKYDEGRLSRHRKKGQSITLTEIGCEGKIYK